MHFARQLLHVCPPLGNHKQQLYRNQQNRLPRRRLRSIHHLNQNRMDQCRSRLAWSHFQGSLLQLHHPRAHQQHLRHKLNQYIRLQHPRNDLHHLVQPQLNLIDKLNKQPMMKH